MADSLGSIVVPVDVRIEAETRSRLAACVGKEVPLVIDYASFELAPDAAKCHEVLSQCAMDRIAGAFEWFCEWPSCRRILQHSLQRVEVKYGTQSTPPRVHRGCVYFEEPFSAVDTFPLANTIAHVLDETFGLYRGRVYDIRQKLIPAYEKQLQQVLGVNVDLRLNIGSFGLLDWEEDNFYNAYTQLVPSNADKFFGRIPEALAELCVNKQDRIKLQENIRVVEIKLSLKTHQRINLKGNRLKLSERFWNGIEHTKEDIKSCLMKKLNLGFDVNLWISEMHTDVIPYWTEVIARTLGKNDGAVPVVVSWKTFSESDEMVRAVNTIFRGRSALVLERVSKALQRCVEEYPNAATKLHNELTKVRIKCSDATHPRKTKCHVKFVRDRSANPKQYDRHGRRFKQARPLREPQYYGRKLVISAPFGLHGDDGAFSVEQMVEALVTGFDLSLPVNDEHFFVTQLVQGHDGVEMQGCISEMNMFQEVFGMMEGYTSRMQQRARTFLTAAATASGQHPRTTSVRIQEIPPTPPAPSPHQRTTVSGTDSAAARAAAANVGANTTATYPHHPHHPAATGSIPAVVPAAVPSAGRRMMARTSYGGEIERQSTVGL